MVRLLAAAGISTVVLLAGLVASFSPPTSAINPAKAGLRPPMASRSDGDLIAFYSERDGNAEIYLMNADGTNQRNLTRNRANEYWPNWRPHPRPTPTPTVVATPGPRARVHLQRIGG